MTYEVTHIHPFSAAKISAALSFLMTSLFCLLLFTALLSSESMTESIGVSSTSLLLFPVYYLLFGYIFGLLFALLFNVVAKYLGGLKVTLAER